MAYKVEQGSMKGLFFPLKNSTQEDFKLLASLYVNGQMKEYYSIKKHVSGKLISEPMYNRIRLKSSPCETTNGSK